MALLNYNNLKHWTCLRYGSSESSTFTTAPNAYYLSNQHDSNFTTKKK